MCSPRLSNRTVPPLHRAEASRRSPTDKKNEEQYHAKPRSLISEMHREIQCYSVGGFLRYFGKLVLLLFVLTKLSFLVAEFNSIFFFRVGGNGDLISLPVSPHLLGLLIPLHGEDLCSSVTSSALQIMTVGLEFAHLDGRDGQESWFELISLRELVIEIAGALVELALSMETGGGESPYSLRSPLMKCCRGEVMSPILSWSSNLVISGLRFSSENMILVVLPVVLY